jgi:hypothetical protein
MRIQIIFLIYCDRRGGVCILFDIFSLIAMFYFFIVKIFSSHFVSGNLLDFRSFFLISLLICN